MSDVPAPNNLHTTGSTLGTPPPSSAEVAALLALGRSTPPRGLGSSAPRAGFEVDTPLVGARSPLYGPIASPAPSDVPSSRTPARDHSPSPHSPADAPLASPCSTYGAGYTPSGSVAEMVGSVLPSTQSPTYYSDPCSPPRDDRSTTSSYMSSRDLWILDGILDTLTSLDDLPGTVRWIRVSLRDCINDL